MKKTLSLLLTLALMMSCCLVPPALAADTAPRVRVNGTLVEFPDQGPVIDAANRTLVPVRFATEALGADVQWDHGTKTATISKGGASVAVTIGKREIAVTKGGTASTVAMDTEAVLLGGRTMVPICYVAEALGAYVDYSARHRVVGIYQGELTPEQIAELQKLDMTLDSNVINEDDNNALMLPANTGSWADLREDLYAQKYAKGNHYYHDLEKYLPAETSAEYFDNLIKNTEAAIEYHSDNLDVEFAADPSCIYQQINKGDIHISVRGYVTVTEKIDVNDMTGGERWLLISLLGTRAAATRGVPYTFPIDAHVLGNGGVQLHEVWNFETGALGK